MVGVPVRAPSGPTDVPAGVAPAVTENVAGDIVAVNAPPAAAPRAMAVGPDHAALGEDCPSRSSPQHRMSPAVRTAHEWRLPAVMEVTVPRSRGGRAWSRASRPQQ